MGVRFHDARELRERGITRLRVNETTLGRGGRPRPGPGRRRTVFWLSLPSADKPVDVFYVYPTVSSNATGFMDVNSVNERALAQGIFAAQASVYEPNANVFSPYYRQMSTQVAVEPGMSRPTRRSSNAAPLTSSGPSTTASNTSS